MAATSLSPNWHDIDNADNPHLRFADYWRDGKDIAALLETCFQNEGIDDNGDRFIRGLRNYNLTQQWTLQGAKGFVWVTDGKVLGNASIQRHPLRRDTWIIGNVATHPHHRGRGIATATVNACVGYAIRHAAKHIGLQVATHNLSAQHIYERLGFQPLADVQHFSRGPIDGWHADDGDGEQTKFDGTVRPVRWHGHRHDAASIWALTQNNLPASAQIAEPIDPRTYKVNLIWHMANAINGTPEKWFVAESNTNTNTNGVVVGAVRTRVNLDGGAHQIELMLGDLANAATAQALIQAALRRFADYISRPIVTSFVLAAGNERIKQTALQAAGFKPLRVLRHMCLQ
jgi:ribosomal protein S18 acetylase RimI-like enzyme